MWHIIYIYIYIYIYIHTHTHTHTYTYIHIYIHTHSHIAEYMYIFLRSGDRAWWKILIMKQIRCTNSSNLFLEQNSTRFGKFLFPSSGVFHCTHSSGICHTGLLCVQWKIPDGGQGNCPKHVEFYSKNKFEKLVHVVGFYYKNLILELSFFPLVLIKIF